MKYAVIAIGVLSLASLSCKDTSKAVHYDPIVSVEHDTTVFYDSILAQELGADDYGMRQYVMALLKAGPNRDQDSAEVMELQRAHLDNISRLAEEGTLVLAGPLMDQGDLMGIYVFAVGSLEQADSLTSDDPAIQAGRLNMELIPWYGSAAVMKINEIHKRIAKVKI